MGCLDNLEDRIKSIVERIQKAKKVHIVSHIDADGITSASIAYKALERAGIELSYEFIKQLESDKIASLKEEGHELIWFTDFGSGQLDSLRGIDCVITDHHEPQGDAGSPTGVARGNILNYGSSSVLELNPHRYGLDGATEISGAGTTYLVARKMGENEDLSKLAIVGAVGDLQTMRDGKLVGKNREILKEGANAGYVEFRLDTTLYGLESRPLTKVLQYASDPVLPGLTGDGNACSDFLTDLDIPLKSGGDWRKWYNLTKEEKSRIISAIGIRMLEHGYPTAYVESLVGEVYTFPGEEEGSMVHEAKEFSTLLNSCGRYNKGDIGLHICLGDRDEYYKKAMQLLLGHRQVLVDCMKYVESEGVTRMDNLQYFHGGDRIPDTVLGTVVGMVMGSGEVDRDVPMLGFVESSEKEGLKVSSRGTKQQTDAGLDLSAVMSECSKKLGGEGGGHNIAAGAFIPEGTEEDFLSMANEMIKKQMN